MARTFRYYLRIVVCSLSAVILGLLAYDLVIFEERCSSISFVGVETERARFINGIESYQSPEELTRMLDSESFSWEVFQDGRDGGTKWRPPFDFYGIAIKNYTHMGFTGILEISFFNRRLMSTRFYPLETDKYITQLEHTEGIKFSKDEYGELNVKVSRYAVVRVGKKHGDERKFVEWSDSRLEREIYVWIKRYS